MKIGQYVREHLIPLLEKLDQDDFKRLLDDVAIGKTKDIFGLHNASEKIPFLVLKGNEDASLRRYYYTKNPIERPNGETYYLTSEYSGENKPAFRNGGNRQTGMQETALAA